MKRNFNPIASLVGFCAWMGALIGLAIALYQPSGWWLTRDWVPMDAKINVAQIDQFGTAFMGRWNRLSMSYTYEVAGQGYMGRLPLPSLQQSPAGLELKQTFLRLEGTGAQVLVNPLQPANSIVSRQIVWAEVWFGLGLALMSLAVIGVLGLQRQQRQMPTHEQALSLEQIARSAHFTPGQEPQQQWLTPLPWASLVKLAVVLVLAFLVSSHFAWSNLDNSGSPFDEAESAEAVGAQVAGQKPAVVNIGPVDTVKDAVKPAPMPVPSPAIK
jgi:hypothetical protein